MNTTTSHPTSTQEIFKSMKTRLKCNPGHGYVHESSPGTGMSSGMGSTSGSSMGARPSSAPRGKY